MFRTALLTAVVAAALVGAGTAQSRGRTTRTGSLSCADRDRDSDRVTRCEVREDTIGGANPLDIDAGRNGGIRILGWDRGDVLVRARIEAQADTDADARRLVAGVRIDTSGGRVRADGPDTLDRDESWSVSFEIDVPRNAMLTLNTNNGGIVIDDFRGTATFHAKNGGLALHNVGGDLRGETTNGGVTLDVTGDHWDGSGLDVETRNGGINLNLPKGFSAELEAGTTHGRVSVDFPITVQGRIGRHLETTLGAGGPKLRAITTNGGVTIRQR
ncbi:MAG TPA: DUF4097 family beta strand repeat-containing protein [Vicinamibacterales bacterium]|nr:DUF4097 family beta strand repeat-containing protein [Vicinamibacterales bacterium]